MRKASLALGIGVALVGFMGAAGADNVPLPRPAPLPKTGLAAAAAIIFAAGCWSAAKIAKASASKDPHAVVIDEVAGQCLVLLPAPLDLLSYSVGFLLFRTFDIWKPWPIRWADRHVPGGLGIMLDDLLAAVYAALVLSVLLAIVGAIGVQS